jgi:hypothetical protein
MKIKLKWGDMHVRAKDVLTEITEKTSEMHAY